MIDMIDEVSTVSYTSIVLRVETIRVPRADGCGSPGQVARICSDMYHKSMMMNVKIMQQEMKLHTVHFQDVQSAFRQTSPR